MKDHQLQHSTHIYIYIHTHHKFQILFNYIQHLIYKKPGHPTKAVHKLPSS
ncbi:hypothetical protein Hanom_Chr02g00142991 [Helianthus anomalus]